jgi:hypothetical protein
MKRMLQLRRCLPLLALAASLQITLGYYDPAAQRWINLDPLLEAGSLNLYQFTDNQPIGRIDSHGLISDETLCGKLESPQAIEPLELNCSKSACRVTCAAVFGLATIWGCDFIPYPYLKALCKTGTLLSGLGCLNICSKCLYP